MYRGPGKLSRQDENKIIKSVYDNSFTSTRCIDVSLKNDYDVVESRKDEGVDAHKIQIFALCCLKKAITLSHKC